MDDTSSMCLYLKLNLDANSFRQVDSKDCMNSASVRVQAYVSLDRGTVCAHGNADYLLENLSCEMLSTRNSSILMMSSSVYSVLIGSDIHTSVYDKRDDFGFPIVHFPWLSGDVPRLPSYGIYISQLVRFARCCTSVFDFHFKNLQITSKLLTQGYRYHKLRKTFGKFFRSYSELLSKFGDISFQEYLSKGISHPVFYGDLVYKLRRVKDTPNFILSGSKIVKRLRRRQYDPVIIERTISLVLGPSTALYEPFLKHCTLTNKAVGTL